MEDSMETARRLAQKVAGAGGRTFFVGGFVRDRLLGIPNKDVDVEVHGIEAGTLEEILDTLGQRTQMGLSFGVYGLKHCSLDIAMPRKEQATGRGHRDFAVYTDPFLGPEKAARRRDFTVNALMEDVLTGEIVDPFGGRRDLEKGILRHVSDDSFPEDPLRVLRGAQFAARFGFRVAEETVRLCKTMDLSALPRERVLGELQKALEKAPRPSVFFEVLRQMEQLTVWFPELQTLIGVPQDPVHHPEGDAWTHTMAVLDAAAGLREAEEHPRYLLMAALCHDLGKAETTVTIENRVRSIGHEEAGVTIAQRLLDRLGVPREEKKYVQNMVLLHMRPNALAGCDAGVKSTNKLFDSALCPEDLILLARADRLGQKKDPAGEEAWLRSRLESYRETMAKPYVMGRDLMEMGFAPDARFSQALAYAHKLRLAGVEKADALKQTVGYLRKLQ